MTFDLQFTDKAIPPWGGLSLRNRLLDHIGFDAALAASALPQPGRKRGYRPEQLIMPFMLGVWCGANRFEQGDVTRHDHVLQRLFGVARMANFKAVIRLFRKFDPPTNEGIFGTLSAWLVAQVHLDVLTLDLDSPVMTRSGVQDGAAKGYNPAKPGRNSHHPLLACVADTRLVAKLWLRPGNSHTANHVSGFLAATRERQGATRGGLLRADSGFSDDAFLRDLEQREIPFLVAAKLPQPLQRALVAQTGWWSLADGLDLVSFDYQRPSWATPRTVVAIRQHRKYRDHPKGKTLSVFADDPGHGHDRYGVIVTSLDLPAQERWRTY